jgi:hypothetical protein
VHATNGDSAQRYANVVVNGQGQKVAFLPSKDGNTPASSVLNVYLSQGSGNSVRFEGVDGGWGEFFPFSLRCSCVDVRYSNRMFCSPQYRPHDGSSFLECQGNRHEWMRGILRWKSVGGEMYIGIRSSHIAYGHLIRHLLHLTRGGYYIPP